MRMLTFVDEFRCEADKAIFTKEQALTVMKMLLEKELNEGRNSESEASQLAEALAKIDVSYVDPTKTQTDQMLDELDVARLTAEDIVSALETILFEVTM